jgi:phosphoribosylanthranilate isomerase
MLKTKVKISKVNNLTDARYFAAMGADYLGFCCNAGTEMYCSPGRIKEIAEWVEGPQFVLEFDGWQEASDITSILITGLGQAVHFGAFATYTDDFSVPVFKDYILENIKESELSGVHYPVIRSEKSYNQLDAEELTGVKNFCNSFRVFLDLSFTPDELPELLNTLPVYGLILRGGQEEKVGFKSYNELDKIFEKLEL